MTTPPKVTFIPADEADDSQQASPTESTALIERPLWEKRLEEIANSPGSTFRVPRNETLKKKQVVDSILDAFQLIGGTSRLALWANANEGEFFKLYAKLAPRQLEKEVTHEGDVKIVHVLPRGKLDT